MKNILALLLLATPAFGQFFATERFVSFSTGQQLVEPLNAALLGCGQLPHGGVSATFFSPVSTPLLSSSFIQVGGGLVQHCQASVVLERRRPRPRPAVLIVR